MTLLEKNLAVLAERNPLLPEDLLKNYEPHPGFQAEQTASGDPTAKLEGHYLHSSRAPRREAAKLFTKELPRADILILQGFAMGYHAEEYLKLRSSGEIWIIEPDIPLFLAVCAARDISPLLKNPRVTLLLDPKVNTLEALAGNLPDKTMAVAKIRSVYEKDRGYYQDVDRTIGGILARREINKNTLKRFGALWVRNLFHNLPLLARARGVWRLEGIFQDLPVLILAAGPSLEELLPLLKYLKERVVIVAVDTALYALSRAGIDPDFLVVVDPQFLNSRHLDGLTCSGSFLVADSSTHPRIFRSRPRGVFFSESPFPLGKAVEGGTDIRGRLGAGGSVATAAWEVARHGGAGEIYCGGLDLGFPDNQTHQKDSFFERRALYSTGRLHTLERAGFMALRDGVTYRGENNSGGRTLSDRRMEVYAQWFESRAAAQDAPPAWNLSPRGIALKGIPHKPAEELLALPLRREEIDRRMDKLRTPPPPPEGSFYRGLENLQRDLAYMEERGRRGLALLKELKSLIKGNEREGSSALQDSINRLDLVDQEILATTSRNVTGFLFQDLIDEISRSDDADEGGNDPLESIRNSRSLYRGIVSSSSYHLAILGEALDRLDLP